MDAVDNPLIGHDLAVELDAWLEREVALKLLEEEIYRHDDWGVEAKLHHLLIVHHNHATLIAELAETVEVQLDDDHRQTLERLLAERAQQVEIAARSRTAIS